MKLKDFVEMIQKDKRLDEEAEIWIGLDNEKDYLSPDACFHFGIIDACDGARNYEGKYDVVLVERSNKGE